MKTLKQVYQNQFLMGNIYTPRLLENEPLQAMLNTQFDVLTAENIMKPALIQPRNGDFTFENADLMLEYANKNNQLIVGHTLAWHQQTLSWIDEANTSKEEALALLKAHLTAIMTRYKGKIIAWDVLNEAIEDGVQADPADWRLHLRDTPWLRMIGPVYINHVFHVAHELDPDAVLYYNDYNLNYPQKRKATYYMVKDLKAAGVPIHGIGMQGHYHTNTPIHTVSDSLELFSLLDGVEISVTELDVTVTGSEKLDRLTPAMELEQAQYYAQLFQIYNRFAAIITRITFWGSDDVTSWRGERFPTIFNGDYSPKLAYHAIIDPEKFLTDHPPIPKDVTLTAVAKKATSDFEDRATWDLSAAIVVTKQLTAWEGATGVVNAIWDDNHLYLFVDVTDTTVNDNDRVDLYLGEQKYSFAVANRDVVRVTMDGYTFKVALPLAELAIVDGAIGFDIQINDANEKGERQSAAAWNNFTHTNDITDARLGVLQLVE